MSPGKGACPCVGVGRITGPTPPCYCLLLLPGERAAQERGGREAVGDESPAMDY